MTFKIVDARVTAETLASALADNVDVLEAMLETLKPGKPKRFTGQNGVTKIVTATKDGKLVIADSAAPKKNNEETETGDGTEEMAWVDYLVKSFLGFRMLAVEHNDRRVVVRIDTHTKELRLTDPEAVQAAMRNYLGASVDFSMASAVVRRTFDRLAADRELVIKEAQVAPLLFEDQHPEQFCYRRLPISSFALNEVPAPFQELLERATVDGARSLVLWLGSLLDPSSNRSQYLVLYGPGNNGKSSLIDSLVRVLGDAAVTMSAGDFLNRFGLGDAANARLLAFDDNNNASFMTSGDFKRVTGSQYVRIERKGKDAYKTRNNLKIVIACNRLPKLTGDDADMRRNILVRLESYKVDNGQPGADSGWVRRLQEAMPDVLRYCYTQWVKYRQETGKELIPVPESTKEDVYNASLQAQVDDFMQEYLDVGEGRTLKPRDLEEKAKYAGLDPKTYEYLKHVMQERFRFMRKEGVRMYVDVGLCDPK